MKYYQYRVHIAQVVLENIEGRRRRLRCEMFRRRCIPLLLIVINFIGEVVSRQF